MLCHSALPPRVSHLTFPGTSFLLDPAMIFSLRYHWDEEMAPWWEWVIRISRGVRCRYQAHPHEPSSWVKELTMNTNKLGINRESGGIWQAEGRIQIPTLPESSFASCFHVLTRVIYMSGSVLEKNKFPSALMFSSVFLSLFYSPT